MSNRIAEDADDPGLSTNCLCYSTRRASFTGFEFGAHSPLTLALSLREREPTAKLTKDEQSVEAIPALL